MDEINYDIEIKESAQHVLDVMAERVSPEELERIRQAFEFAREAHKDQRRKTGAPYIIHPIAVATIAAEEMKLDTNSVICAFLHDVVEDTEYTLDDIRERFGDDVAFLVDVVTKKKKKEYKMSKQVDNYQQLLDSLHYDIRALLVKIADRLHNMRTLSSMRPDKQMKIAGETDYFYAPLANRLGLYDVKTDLENLSFKYRCPKEYDDLVEVLKQDKINDKERLDEFCTEIGNTLSMHGIWAKAEVFYRRPFSLWRRMKAQDKDIKHIDNHYYVRVTYTHSSEPLSDKDICLKIYSLLTDLYKEKPGSFVNQIDQQKENSYKSINVMLLSSDGVWEDVQIVSEEMVAASKLGCMAQVGEGGVQEWMERFKKVLQEIAKQSSSGNFFIESVVSNLYYDDIMVFTPNGDSIVLPKGATAIDFAFYLHTDIGLRAKYSRINGKLRAVSTVLKKGDVVEIFSSDHMQAQPEWFEHAVTYKAKKAIKQQAQHSALSGLLRCPVCNPIPGGEVIGIRNDKGLITIHRRNCREAIKQASKHGDSVVSVSQKIEGGESITFSAKLKLRAVARVGLLTDIISTFTDKLYLPIDNISYENDEHIVKCQITFRVHSITEYDQAKALLYKIEGIDEIRHMEDDNFRVND